ncbi:MAG: CdaR family protein [Flavobacteriaceae bacterium]
MKKVKSGLVKRKVNIFLIFLICSFLAWLVSRLSEVYTQGTSFDLVYTNVPDSLRLTKTSKEKVDVRLRASGFQFLGFNFRTKQIAIDLSEVDRNETDYYIPQRVYRKQIQNQLSGSMTLLEVDRDTLFFEFFRVYEREVPIQSNITVNLGQNYLMDGDLLLEPTTVVLKGPKKEIESIDAVSTLKMVLTDLNADFESRAALNIPNGLKNTDFSVNSVKVSGKVFRFSERIIEIPIQVINLPEGTAIRTFPETVSVLCKARINTLKELEVSDFVVAADYSTVKRSRQNLSLTLTQKPESVHSAQLLENEVEFILKRE